MASQPKQILVFDSFGSYFLLTPQMGVHLLNALPAGSLIYVQLFVVHEVHANLFIYIYLVSRHEKQRFSAYVTQNSSKLCLAAKSPVENPTLSFSVQETHYL